MFLIIIVLSFAASALVRVWMKRTYNKWSQTTNSAGIDGQLSDHYIPSQKLMRLSADINNAPSVASIAVAAHECGHAIQDKEGLSACLHRAVTPIMWSPQNTATSLLL